MSDQATVNGPTIRVRISHAHTLKDGWRCDSTTVEWVGPCPVHWAAISDAMRDAHTVARIEADDRNREGAPS